jgi:hypothetical protein
MRIRTEPCYRSVSRRDRRTRSARLSLPSAGFLKSKGACVIEKSDIDQVDKSERVNSFADNPRVVGRRCPHYFGLAMGGNCWHRAGPDIYFPLARVSTAPTSQSPLRREA